MFLRFYRYRVFLPVQRRAGSRDTHKTDTRTSQTNRNLKTNPTHRLTRQTTPEPRDARVATHYTTHPIKRGGGDDGDGDGARTWEQRGREPDGIGDGTPPRAGRCGGKSGFGTGTVPVLVPVCLPCVSRVCPGSPRCLFTGTAPRDRPRAPSALISGQDTAPHLQP